MDPGSNEISALRALLGPFAVQGQAITADALHTQRETARFPAEGLCAFD